MFKNARFWYIFKRQESGLKGSAKVRKAEAELGAVNFFRFSDSACRPHLTLCCRTPALVFFQNSAPPEEASAARSWTAAPVLVS